MEEMVGLLGVLREDPRLADGRADGRADGLADGVADGLAADVPSPGGPLPGLGDLGELVEQARAGGLDVRVRIHPADLLAADAVGGGVGLVIYRIVQEALTNALKHAGPHARVEVLVQRTATHLEVEVRDDGGGARGGATGILRTGRHAVTASGTRSGGYGVLGMRERVAACGGAVSVGHQVDGGFAVHAWIPVAS